ncbi:DUF479 domain-containing protein [bacterium SCSIO 12696]|nr:DUF479 domain-containing protein [bacterium SCSIO 12696]
MNYLAHILLSGDEPEIKIGGLLGDFVKGPLRGQYPHRIEQGIALHRAIDSWFDQQSQVIAARARFEPPLRRFAGIIVDICYDHLLAKNWQQHHPQPLNRFSGDFYQLLRDHYHLLPQRAQRFTDHAPGIGLLENYAHRHTVGLTLSRIEQRFRRPVDLSAASVQLEHQWPQLQREFDQLFPRARAFAEQHR